MSMTVFCILQVMCPATKTSNVYLFMQWQLYTPQWRVNIWVKLTEWFPGSGRCSWTVRRAPDTCQRPPPGRPAEESAWGCHWRSPPLPDTRAPHDITGTHPTRSYCTYTQQEWNSGNQRKLERLQSKPPVEAALVVTYLQFPIQVCFPRSASPSTTPTSVTTSPTHYWTHLWF